MSSWRRMGGFLIALGIFFAGLFVLSDSVSQPEFSLLAGGFGCVVIGVFLLVTHPAPASAPAPRFRVLSRRKGEPAPKREQAKNSPAPKPSAPQDEGGKPQSKPAGPPGGPGDARGGGGKPGGKPAGKR